MLGRQKRDVLARKCGQVIGSRKHGRQVSLASRDCSHSHVSRKRACIILPRDLKLRCGDLVPDDAAASPAFPHSIGLGL
jgi:hypothetical protein